MQNITQKFVNKKNGAVIWDCVKLSFIHCIQIFRVYRISQKARVDGLIVNYSDVYV